MALVGTSFGVDFNPVVDRLRIISDTGQNLRVNVDTGATLVDATLTYSTAASPATGVTGAAYTNNDADPNTATTLYDVDSMLDQVAIQSPANAGTLSATGKLTVDTTPSVGFDIYSTIRNGTTVDIQGFASLTVGGQARFYKITLFTGKANLRGAFRAQDQVIRDRHSAQSALSTRPWPSGDLDSDLEFGKVRRALSKVGVAKPDPGRR